MKKFVEIMMSMKNNAAMIFTGYVMSYAVIGSFFGLKELSFSLIWQFLAISIICTALQWVAFTEHILKKAHYAQRLVLFAVALYACILGFAIGFRWFPIQLEVLAIFTAIFIFILLVLTVVFHIYFKITGTKYNEMLSAYKSRQEEQ